MQLIYRPYACQQPPSVSLDLTRAVVALLPCLFNSNQKLMFMRSVFCGGVLKSGLTFSHPLIRIFPLGKKVSGRQSREENRESIRFSTLRRQLCVDCLHLHHYPHHREYTALVVSEAVDLL